MPDSSAPWDGAQWAEVDWYRHMTLTLPSGIHGAAPGATATDGALAWAATGLTITPAAGRANVGGAGYVRTAPLTSISATANTHGSFSRRDRLVLRRNVATHGVALAVIAGTAASSPLPPAYTQDDQTFDLPLFSFLVPPASGTTISGVVDERAWVHPYGRPVFVQAAAPALAADGSLWFQVN